MNSNNIIITLLLCTLLSFSAADNESKNIQIVLLSGNQNNKIVVAVQNAQVDTIAVLVKDSSDAARWISMNHNADAGVWTTNNEDGVFSFPVSFTLISADNENFIVANVDGSADAPVIDTGLQYSSGDANSPRRKKPTTTTSTCPTKATTTTKAPATVTTTRAPAQTTTTTTRAPSSPTTTTTTKATSSPTRAPTTRAPTTRAPSSPTTTTTTTTRAPSNPTTTTTTTTPSSGSSKLKLMVPLYTYPGASWNAVAAGASKVPTLAIINPNSGPGNGPDSTYTQYMNMLHNAGVQLVGYVHTSYGARSLTLVKADINKYASEFPLVVGIFIDEAAATAAQVSYYTEVHNYIMSMPGFKFNILNPGTAPTSAYLSISTQIVTFENSVSMFSSSSNPSYATAATKDKFAVITYGASVSQMQSAVATAKSKGYYGWVYVTDRSDICCIYNTLSTYYAQQVSYIASI